MTTCFIISPSLRDIQPAQVGDRNGGREAAKTSFRVPGLARDIQVKIASERHEFKQAFELLAANYRARGYEAHGEKPYRFTAYHALPGTVTFVAIHDGKVVATFSLVPDSRILGLPMECIYGQEVARLRRDGYRLGEVTSLADTGLSAREFIQVLKALMKLAMQFDLRRGGNGWTITVNPRHGGFYQKVLGFVPLGPQRYYPSVQNHPAEAYLLTVASMAANAPQMYEGVVAEALPESALVAPHWSEDHVRYFGARSSQIDESSLKKLLRALADARYLSR